MTTTHTRLLVLTATDHGASAIHTTVASTPRAAGPVARDLTDGAVRVVVDDVLPTPTVSLDAAAVQKTISTALFYANDRRSLIRNGDIDRIAAALTGPVLSLLTGSQP
jgi:hypothetical protein